MIRPEVAWRTRLPSWWWLSAPSPGAPPSWRRPTGAGAPRPAAISTALEQLTAVRRVLDKTHADDRPAGVLCVLRQGDAAGALAIAAALERGSGSAGRRVPPTRRLSPPATRGPAASRLRGRAHYRLGCRPSRGGRRHRLADADGAPPFPADNRPHGRAAFGARLSPGVEIASGDAPGGPVGGGALGIDRWQARLTRPQGSPAHNPAARAVRC
jgi:hypothetical protein